MPEETAGLNEAPRRRGILFVPVAIIAALFGVLLSDPLFIGFGLIAVVAFAIGVPPSKDPSKTNWPALFGIGVLGLCVLALLYNSAMWVSSDWLLPLGSVFLALLLTVAFGFRLLLDLVSKNRVSRLRTNAKQYLAIVGIFVFAMLSAKTRLPTHIRFGLERPAIEKAVRQIEARCASDNAPTPTFHGTLLTDWKCDAESVSFVVGTWSGFFGAGEWGFLRGTPTAYQKPGDARWRTFSRITGSWWMWTSTTWID